jgi:hypothetical protein
LAKTFEQIKIRMDERKNFRMMLSKTDLRPKNTEKRCLLQGIVTNGFISGVKAPDLLYPPLPACPCGRCCVVYEYEIDWAGSTVACFAERVQLYRAHQ